MSTNRGFALPALGAILVAGMAGLLLTAWRGGPAPALSAVLMLIFGLIGVFAAFRATRRRDADRRTVRAWTFVAAGTVALLVSLLLYAIPDTDGFPLPGDYVRFGFVVLLFLATRSFPVDRVTGLGRRKFAIDTCTVAVGTSMLMWYLVVGPAVSRDDISTGTALLAAGVAVTDLVPLFGFARVLMRGADPGARRPVALLAGAMLVLTVNDGYVGYLHGHYAHIGPPPLIVLCGRVLFYFLVAAAAVEQSRVRDENAWDLAPVPRRVGSRLPYVAVRLGYALMIAAAARDQGAIYPWAGLLVGGMGLTGLVMLRQATVQQESDQAAATDSLTGLANRACFHELLAADVGRPGTAVLLIDLNGFKQVNDSRGHQGGDQLLVAFAGMLRESILGLDVPGRLGGDEFAVLAHHVASAADAEAVARRIAAATTEPVLIDGVPVTTSASIGIAIAGGRITAEELLHRADIAMYHAKRNGSGTRWAVWDEAMGTGAEPSLEDELRAAVAAGALSLVYQPIVALPDGEVRAVEALARWQHPERGLIGPDIFIPLAERIGVIGELGRWVLREACDQVRDWPVTLSVNVSPLQLNEDRFSTDVLAIAAGAGLSPHRLILEVTENALINGEVPAAHLRILSDAGIRIALDDFGTGYSSLQYLTRLPIAILKLDSCFVAALDGSAEGAAVAQAVVRLGHALRLETVAEGVETDFQARELILLGCDSAQGYHFARPAPADAIRSTLVSG